MLGGVRFRGLNAGVVERYLESAEAAVEPVADGQISLE